eukprot:14014413-Alexandrium_andersonii.AAC.1
MSVTLTPPPGHRKCGCLRRAAAVNTDACNAFRRPRPRDTCAQARSAPCSWRARTDEAGAAL